MTVQCATGTIAVGGGAYESNANRALTTTRPLNSTNAPAGNGDTPTGWEAKATDTMTIGGTDTITVYVICAN